MATEEEEQDEALIALAERLRAAGAGRVEGHASLAPYTTWRVGGPADLLCVTEQVEQLVAALDGAAALGLPWRVLGRGSNVLVRDGGMPGLVVVNRTSGLRIDGATVQAESGLLLSTVAQRAASAGLAGMEWGAGIPGSLGGAVVSNAGAHGRQLADSLQSACLWYPSDPRSSHAGEFLSVEGAGCHEGAASSRARPSEVSGVIGWAPAASLDLSYRHSWLRAGDRPPAVVLRAELLLTTDDPAAIRARMAEERRQRQATQPLSQASAGSVFKNPPGDSAAKLIDLTGLKGMRIGGAQVSPKHANFMVTEAVATAADVLALIALVQGRVRERFGVDLVLEVQPIGRETHETG